MTNEPEAKTPEQIAHAWQDFRKWCVERAIDAKATAESGNIVSTAKAIAYYVIRKDELETKVKSEEKAE